MRAGREPGDAPGLRPVGRLRRRPEFLAVGKDGRRIHFGSMTVQGLRRADDRSADGLLVGFTVTKREGHATERNRIRRRLRAAAASLGAGPHAPERFDLVLVGRRDALSAPFPALVADLRRALDRLTEPGGSRSSGGRRRRTESVSP